MDRFIADAAETLDPGELAPRVFEVAEAGDAVARDILVEAGRDLGRMARIVAGRLFDPGAAFPLVLGGSVLQDGACDAMRAAVIAEVRARFEGVRPVVLGRPPLDGAVLLAADLLEGKGPAKGGLL